MGWQRVRKPGQRGHVAATAHMRLDGAQERVETFRVATRAVALFSGWGGGLAELDSGLQRENDSAASARTSVQMLACFWVIQSRVFRHSRGLARKAAGKGFFGHTQSHS